MKVTTSSIDVILYIFFFLCFVSLSGGGGCLLHYFLLEQKHEKDRELNYLIDMIKKKASENNV